MPEELVLTAYAAMGLLLAVRWWPDRRTTVGAAFYAGGALLAASVVVDALSDVQYLLEDTLKVLGLVAWGLCGAWAVGDGLASRPVVAAQPSAQVDTQ